MNRPTEPGERRPTGRPRPRLEQAPGLRYERPEGSPVGPPRPLARSLAIGLLVGLAGSAAIVVLGGVLALTAGLLAVAGLTGWAIGRALLPAPRIGTGLRIGVAVLLAIDAVLVGQIGLWLYARSEGGALSLLDYLGQTWGLLIPAQLVASSVGAWWSAR